MSSSGAILYESEYPEHIPVSAPGYWSCDKNSIFLSSHTHRADGQPKPPSELISESDVSAGRIGIGFGCAGVPGWLSSSHSPVICDDWGTFRDPKHPTIGYRERPLVDAMPRVLHRYVYEGSSPTVRESYRYKETNSRNGVPVVNGGRDYERADTTRFIRLNATGPGAVLYWDCDGTVDQMIPDTSGSPLLLFRARQGTLTLPVSKNVHRWSLGKFELSHKTERQVSGCMTDTGYLKGLPLAPYPFMDYQPWIRRYIEPDVLMGRIGVAGWNGLNYDPSTRLGQWFPVIEPGWWETTVQYLSTWEGRVQLGHDVLDAIGFVPFVGDAVDLVHAGIYGIEAAFWYSQGDNERGNLSSLGATTSLVSALPFFGDSAKFGKWTVNKAFQTGVKRFAVQKTMEAVGGTIGEHFGGEQGKFWGQLAGGIGGGLVNARNARKGVGWLFQRERYKGTGGFGFNKVDLATGNRVTKGVITGIDFQMKMDASEGIPRPRHWRVHFHAGKADVRFGTTATNAGRFLKRAHLPWEGLREWKSAFTLQEKLMAVGEAAVGLAPSGYGIYRFVDWWSGDE